jgi:hypothetical protein
LAEEYRFNIGELDTGVGLAFSIVADTPEHAVELIRKYIPETFAIRDHGPLKDIVLYIEDEYIKPTDLGDVAPGFECWGCGKEEDETAPCYYESGTDEALCARCHTKEG